MAKSLDSPATAEFVFTVEPEAGIRVRNGRVSSIAEGVDVTPLKELLSAADARVRPLYGVSEEWLQERTGFTETLMGKNQLLDLSIFYKATCPINNLAALIKQLPDLPHVQCAYIKPRAAVHFIDESPNEIAEQLIAPKVSDLTGYQEYLLSASKNGGIDAEYAWKKPGGCGRGVKIIDIEGAWRFSHEDLTDNQGGCIGGTQIKDIDWRKHGTCVLGMLGGDRNGFGVTGICPEAYVRTVSIFANEKGEPSADWDSAAAIRLAADSLSAGHIILIELHRAGPAVNFHENDNDPRGYIPIEWWPCDMAAILYATERGILVVEAGGNGQENLCDDIYNQHPPKDQGCFADWWSNPFKRDPIDTRAILVGAGVPPPNTHGYDSGPDCSRWELSNFGRVIDAQGWGMEVTTCGGNNDLNGSITNPYEDTHYTRRFSGTSSASAMVAGALGCLQGALRASGQKLEPLQARTLLRDNNLNSPQQDGENGSVTSHPIGPRPDLHKLLDHLIGP